MRLYDEAVNIINQLGHYERVQLRQYIDILIRYNDTDKNIPNSIAPRENISKSKINMPDETYQALSHMEKSKLKHPRAYQSWTDDEEKQMLSLLQSGKSVSYIAKILQRQPGAIRSRIRKIENREA